MSKISRIGDRTQGICYAHNPPLSIGGAIITGSPTVKSEGWNVARLGDIIVSDCGHTSTIVTASSNAKANGSGVARIGDKGEGTYKCTIISGSNKDSTT